MDSVTTDSATQTRTANRQNEITAISGAATPTYDANESMTGDETGKQFVYDAWNRLVTVKNSGGTTLKTYGYDGLNRRVSETASGTTTDLYYSANWQVLEERVAGATVSSYVWSPVYVDAMIARDRDTDGNGSLDERLYPTHDANFNVTGLVNTSGSVVEHYVYDPYGKATVTNATWSVLSGNAYAWQNMFQGGRVEGASGLIYFQMRDYSPSQGRWTTLDPIRFMGGDVDFYRMEGNNSVYNLDPIGLRSWRWVGGGAVLGSPLGPVGIVAGAIGGWHLGNAITPATPAPTPGITPVAFGFSWVPACPCTEGEIQRYQITGPNAESKLPNLPRGQLVAIDDDPMVLMLFHPRATTGYRFFCNGSTSGNQCMYDSSRNLITGGGAAGTPDLLAPGTNRTGHFILDVVPFLGTQGSPAGWSYYHLAGWNPINAPAAPANSFSAPTPFSLLSPLGVHNAVIGLLHSYVAETIEDGL